MPQNKKWSGKIIKFTISQCQNSLWTSCPSNPIHPHGLALNIEAIHQTLALGYLGQCNFAPKPDIIQSDLYWLIGLNNGDSLTGDTRGDPLKLAMGGKGATHCLPLPSSLAFSRSLQVAKLSKSTVPGGSRKDIICRKLSHLCQSLSGVLEASV